MTIKEFFAQKKVKIAAWCVLGVGVVALIIGGVTTGEIAVVVEKIATVVGAL